MKIISEEQIRASFNQEDALEMLREGFRAFSAGQVQLPPAQQFMFRDATGDCCIKSAWKEGSSSFCVKISTGFYQNPSRGLPSNDGLNMVLSAETGQPLALLDDHGWLTGVRTALAGRIAAELLLPEKVDRIAIFGTGLQAELQLRQLVELTACRNIIVWGRSESALSGFRERLSDENLSLITTLSAEECARNASVIVTATPSATPLVRAEWVRPGTHITAVGADSPGKQELDAAILTAAACILVDSASQCGAYGELSHLQEEHRAGSKVIELGSLLTDNAQYVRRDTDITVADLTGLGVQDAQISASILKQFSL
ncbi:NAD(P)-binding domain-containing protein [Cedecea colo]|uniref:Ornithine cyclodeaminase family protein n=1 Tax=Cedecea colo TaxID=2552946 RepID=A0ABX0VN75_9ENTR|nr:NAD(P)-binding domain-containing protein [Cedecea colo]NIY48484.1 ornithine cyclodeaminase family protein [Cedecea colo]